MSETDIAIVGGGLSGSLAAVVLGRAGYRVTLIDRRSIYPPDFRAEKFAGDQVGLLRRLGLMESLAAVSTPYGQVLNARAGQVIDRTRGEHYGILYPDMVRAARAQLPPCVQFVVGRVVDVAAGADRQRVAFSNGAIVEARLVVLATGLGDVLRQTLGIRRRVIFDGHSLTFGFTLAADGGGRFRFPALTYYGDRISDRIDYLTLFPVGDMMRANLFTYRDHRDPWTGVFRREPKATLLAALPGLERFLGDFHIIGPVQTGIMDLCGVENYRRDGVVLIGDAFQTSCPAAGTGISRLLTDVDRLCTVHLPRWLETPGMGVAKIAQFYDDPVKRASDARALRAGEYRRLLSVETGLPWEMRRRHIFLRRRVMGWIRQLNPLAGAA